jgi:hypothetical protein
LRVPTEGEIVAQLAVFAAFWSFWTLSIAERMTLLSTATSSSTAWRPASTTSASSPAKRRLSFGRSIDAGLLTREQRDAELKRLQKAVRDAEGAVARAELEAEKASVEERLAALGA